MPSASLTRLWPPAKTKTKRGRRLVSSPDGWTHVLPSSRSSSISLPSSSYSYSAPEHVPPISLPLECVTHTSTAEAPPRTTDASALRAHDRNVERLRMSDFWKTIEQQIRSMPATGFCESGRKRQIIRTAILFGLGSPTGLCEGGLVDRRRTAGWQLAWFVCVISLIEDVQGEPLGSKLAQEPLYNTYDIRLHEALGIQVVETPYGFDRLGEPDTLVFAPGAEPTVLRRVLRPPASEEHVYPAIFVGCQLQQRRTEEETRFLTIWLALKGDLQERERERWRLPPFEEDEAVFWNMWIYRDCCSLSSLS